MLKLANLATAFLIGLLSLAQAQGAREARTALVIGNAGYSSSPLLNPVNDARDVAGALRAAGFEVAVESDADQGRMEAAIRAFGAALKARGGVGLFYFSGHGIQLSGENYMVPVGENIVSERDVKARAINAGEVLDAMAAANNGLNIFILDACRNNPFASATRSAVRGLARIESNAGLFVSFATSPGAVALDGEGRNSPYTKHLVTSIGTADLSLEETFKRTLKGVHQETSGQQTPWISSSFFGDFVFRPTGTAVASLPPVPEQSVALRPSPRQQASIAPTLAGIYRADGVNPSGSRYRGMVMLAPAGDKVRFTWWIGKEVFRGVGEFAGRMLVVDWGQRHPVIYTLHGGRLEGEWADGSATERLEVFAQAAEGVPPPGGRYRVAGRNPNGSRYTGTVTIARDSGRYRLDWRVGSSTYRGTGTLAGNVLTVDWGSTTPVIYALAADGTLAGLWSAGQAEETLTPE